MMFDFDRPTQRDFTETIKVLAGLSPFIIADITNRASSPLVAAGDNARLHDSICADHPTRGETILNVPRLEPEIRRMGFKGARVRFGAQPYYGARRCCRPACTRTES